MIYKQSWHNAHFMARYSRPQKVGYNCLHLVEFQVKLEKNFGQAYILKMLMLIYTYLSIARYENDKQKTKDKKSDYHLNCSSKNKM